LANQQFPRDQALPSVEEQKHVTDLQGRRSNPGRHSELLSCRTFRLLPRFGFQSSDELMGDVVGFVWPYIVLA
jgi:hypothetical protein